MKASVASSHTKRFGWIGAVGLAGGGAALCLAALWLFRIPIADLWLRGVLADRGVEADFRLQSLGLSGARLESVRLGPEANPDAAAGRLEVSWGWSGGGFRLTAIRLIEPALRLELDRGGTISAGVLERLSGAPGERRPALPRLRLDIEDGRALVAAPFGALTIAYQASGVLGEDFDANATLAPTSRANGAYALADASAALSVSSRNGVVAFRLDGSARSLRWNGVTLRGVQLLGGGDTLLDLAQLRFDARLTADAIDAPARAADIDARIELEIDTSESSLAPAHWRASLQAEAPSLSWGEGALSAEGASASAEAEGDAFAASGSWRLAAESLRSYALASSAPRAEGALTLAFGEAPTIGASADVALRQTRLSAGAREKLRASIPSVGGAPPGPLLSGAERALDAALAEFDLTGPLALHWNGRTGQITAPGPIEARARTGALARLAPLRVDAPAFALQLPQQSLHGAVALELRGDGAPNASLLLDTLDWAPGAALEGEGTLSIEDWRAPEAHASSGELAVDFTLPPDGAGRLTLQGPARLSGPFGAGAVRDAEVDLDLAFSWGQGWRAAPARACMPVRVSAIETAGILFQRGALTLCPASDGAFIAADAAKRLSGGFIVRELNLSGAMARRADQRARLRLGAVHGSLRGVAGDAALDIVSEDARLEIDLSPVRTIAATSRRVSAEARFGETGWRVDGAFEQGALDDPSLPGEVSAIAGRWSAAPEESGAVIAVTTGEARVTAREGEPGARRGFAPMRLAGVEARLREGRLDMAGAVRLEDPASGLAHFTAHHDLASGVGEAHARAETLTFGKGLQPAQISDLARGVIANVQGRAGGAADLAWTPQALSARGSLRLEGVSFATASIPVIEGVNGEIVFDDLFALTTPPGQEVVIGLVNPGLAVRDGRFSFQLLGGGRVVIEQARWPFAGGELAIAPTVLTLGSPETRLELTLRDVDVAALIDELDIPDLAATGTVEGAFPLLLTSRTALIEDAELHAAPDGGVISYVGHAGDAMTGPARMAFDALAGFRYDSLTMRLSGDLSGDVVSSIQFSGRNVGEAVDLASASSGTRPVSVRRAPFRFNVTVSAPFRRLARTIAGVGDPRAALDEAGEAEADEPVDQPTPPPR